MKVYKRKILLLNMFKWLDLLFLFWDCKKQFEEIFCCATVIAMKTWQLILYFPLNLPPVIIIWKRSSWILNALFTVVPVQHFFFFILVKSTLIFFWETTFHSLLVNVVGVELPLPSQVIRSGCFICPATAIGSKINMSLKLGQGDLSLGSVLELLGKKHSLSFYCDCQLGVSDHRVCHCREKVWRERETNSWLHYLTLSSTESEARTFQLCCANELFFW